MSLSKGAFTLVKIYYIYIVKNKIQIPNTALDDLTKKIKEGIQKSGFPLELEMGSLLKKHGWSYSIGELYQDFETGKVREIDITAGKLINGIYINLFIECKKSDDKQIVLYAPNEEIKLRTFLSPVLKFFPYIRNPKGFFVDVFVLDSFKRLRPFKKSIPYSNSLIITKGSVVTSDNVSYLSSINGLVKKSIHQLTNSLAIKQKCRSVYLYLFIFDGKIFQLATSKVEKFDLKEIKYGILMYKHNYQIDSSIAKSNLVKSASVMGDEFCIEVISSVQFEKYLIELNNNVIKIDSKELKDWGKPGPITVRL